MAGSALPRIAVALLGLAARASAIDVCAGDTREPYTCDQDSTHRVCAQLVEDDGTKILWDGERDFWEITNQEAFDWSADLLAEPNVGTGWCICMWATEELIETIGCTDDSKPRINCEATDVCYILQSYTDSGMTGEKDLTVAHDCLSSLCPTQAADCDETVAGSGDSAAVSLVAANTTATLGKVATKRKVADAEADGAAQAGRILAKAAKRLNAANKTATFAPLAPHHPSEEEACATCIAATTFSDCHAGLCTDDSGEYCWCSPDDGSPCPEGDGYPACDDSKARARRATAARHTMQAR